MTDKELRDAALAKFAQELSHLQKTTRGLKNFSAPPSSEWGKALAERQAGLDLLAQIGAAPPPGVLARRPPGFQGGDPHNSANYPGFAVREVKQTDSGFFGGSGGDLFLRAPQKVTNRPVQVRGYRHVVLIGLEQEMTDSAFATALRFEGCSGTIHLEGGDAYSKNGSLLDALALNLAPPVGHQQKLQIQNYRLGPVRNRGTAGHSDGLQCQNGTQFHEIFLDRVTVVSDLQGTFFKDSEDPSDFVKLVRLSRVNYRCCFHAFWQERPSIQVELGDDIWIGDSQRPFGLDVWPQSDGFGQTTGRKAVVSADGSYLTFAGPGAPTGRINKGNPPGGDFAPVGSVGAGYVSPGYV